MKASRTIELICIGASASIVPTSERHSPSFATRCCSHHGLTQDQFFVFPKRKKSFFEKSCSRLSYITFCVESKSVQKFLFFFVVHLQKKLKSSKIEKNKNFYTDLDSTQKVMYITPKQVFEKVDFSLSETPEKPFPGQILTSLQLHSRQKVAT